MKNFKLPGNLTLLLGDDVLAMTSKDDVTSVSSAIYNGGYRKASAVLNVHVPESYDQKLLHEQPEQIILEAAKKLDLNPRLCVGMITAADVNEFSIKTASRDDITVNAIVTAGCSLAETAGENIEASLTTPGTINIIVVIDGNPTESCLLQSFITATEAKTAGLRELDVRSTYTGDLATGTITDSLTIISTNNGPEIKYGGPASKLGKLVGFCTREAVKEAILKNGNLKPTRSVLKRLYERKLQIEELIPQTSKVSPLEMTKEPLIALLLMMAANIDEQVKMGLIPEEFGDIHALSEEFKSFFAKAVSTGGKPYNLVKSSNLGQNSYSFLKSALLSLIENFSGFRGE